MAPKNTANTTSSDAKLDALIASVDALTQTQQDLLRSQEDTKSLLEASLQRVVKLEQVVSSISANQAASTAQLAAHDRDILSLKISNEQLMKATNIRILGFTVLDEETSTAADGGRLLRDKIFSRVIGPILDSACETDLFCHLCPLRKRSSKFIVPVESLPVTSRRRRRSSSPSPLPSFARRCFVTSLSPSRFPIPLRKPLVLKGTT